MNDTETNRNMPNHCPQCGATLPAGTLEGLCPACLLRQGAATDTDTQRVAPFEPPTVAEVAALFPHLEILGFLGKGGMGAVYKARQPALDRIVALKILPSQAASGPGFTERFNREARALAKLSHPNIVALYEFGQVNGLWFFIMEFVDGLNLRELERAGKLSPREALQIVPQICEALQFAHDEGIVHRDIKPENILLDKKGRVKIADFGIAKIMGRGPQEVTETREAMGTPHYMAPEQMEKPQSVDHRADIFSLGVVFYEMLTGELPLGKFAPPSRKVRVDVRLDEVVLRALEKEPEHRYQHASQVKTDVDTIVQTPGASPLPRSVPNRGGRGWKIAAVIAAVGMLLVFFVIGALLLLGIAFPLYQKAQGQPPIVPVIAAAAYKGDLGVYLESLGLVTGTNGYQANTGKDQRLQPVTVVFSIPQQDVSEVVRKFRSGQPLPVEAYTDDRRVKIAEGSLAGVDDQIDPATATLKCRANLLADKDSVLLPNATVTVRMLMDTKHDATLVPATAIVTDQNSKFVFLIAGGGVATMRPVTVGAIDRGMAEIQTGLAPGELVVTEATERLREGYRVNYTLPQTETRQGTLPGRRLDPMSFKVVATGQGPITYQWFKDGTNLIGVTNSGSPPSNEAARLKLQFAEQELKRVEQRRNAGLVSTEEYLNAKAARDIAAAELRGDPAEVARVKLELAEEELKLVEKRREVGAASESEYDQAKLARDLAVVELKKFSGGK